MSQALERERENIRKAARILAAAAKPIRVLKVIDWPAELRTRFFEKGAKELPQPEYKPFDAAPTQKQLSELSGVRISDTTIRDWVARHAESIESAALMLAGMGTQAFFEQGRKLYGEPKAKLVVYPTTPWDLATSVRDVVNQLHMLDIDLSPPRTYDAVEVAEQLKTATAAHFGPSAPKIEIVDVLSANALAGATTIKVRRGARFTDRDAAQLLQHEAFIHVATSLNGRAQIDLPILACGHPYTARFQEGLAVLAELISSAIEMDRFARLADRVFAIQQAIDGANFLDVYKYFLERTGKTEQSYESARRVFRGGVITGGAPFTKDCVYLYGLLQANNTIRALFASGRSDVMPLLFCGKLDVRDLPALCELAAMGLVHAPKFVPPWIRDPRTLFALLTYTEFTQCIETAPLVALAKQFLVEAPRVKFPEAPAEAA
jgi:uncharacterized protein (TIGR02421 family)